MMDNFIEKKVGRLYFEVWLNRGIRQHKRLLMHCGCRIGKNSARTVAAKVNKISGLTKLLSSFYRCATATQRPFFKAFFRKHNVYPAHARNLLMKGKYLLYIDRSVLLNEVKEDGIELKDLLRLERPIAVDQPVLSAR